MEKFIKILKEKIKNINFNTQKCKRCLMDETASGISFSENGCNYCEEFLKIYEILTKNKPNLDDLKERIIRSKPINSKYDCIVGISGGVDSSYTLAKVKEIGLNPLAAHMDNGWNSELATNNIKKLISSLNVDLYTHVIQWDEYRDLMQAFFDADVIDIELLYDNAALAVCYQQAQKYGLKFILAGTNTSTEGFRMPENWNWYKFDKKNILSISKRNNVKIKTFPTIGTIDLVFFYKFKRIKWFNFLDYLENYNKFEAISILQDKYNFKPYPYKHYESIFTRFYQGFILITKFGIDKRKNHLSSLILTNQMEKKEALEILKEIPYPSEKDLVEDIEFFLKKMKWNEKELEEYLQRPPKKHSAYGTEINIRNFLKKIQKIFPLPL